MLDPCDPTEDEEERTFKRVKAEEPASKPTAKCVFHSLARQPCKLECVGYTQLGPWTHAQKKQYEPLFKRWGLMNIFFRNGKRGDPVDEGEFHDHMQGLLGLQGLPTLVAEAKVKPEYVEESVLEKVCCQRSAHV
jgi:hypothetical protein